MECLTQGFYEICLKFVFRIVPVSLAALEAPLPQHLKRESVERDDGRVEERHDNVVHSVAVHVLIDGERRVEIAGLRYRIAGQRIDGPQHLAAPPVKGVKRRHSSTADAVVDLVAVKIEFAIDGEKLMSRILLPDD